MDYDAIDRWASRHVVSCVKHATRFFLTAEGLATDREERARRYSDSTDATIAARDAREEYAWCGFEWEPYPAIGLREE